jgi:hypothetical protein
MPDQVPFFSKEQTLIFPYSDGTQDLLGDPLEINQRFDIFSGGDPERVRLDGCPRWQPAIASLTTEEGEQTIDKAGFNEDGTEKGHWQQPSPEDQERFYEMVRYAFQVQPFDRRTGKGCTRKMLNELWNKFQKFLEKKVESGGDQPTLSPPSVAASLPV